jgi:hypothetical protein
MNASRIYRSRGRMRRGVAIGFCLLALLAGCGPLLIGAIASGGGSGGGDEPNPVLVWGAGTWGTSKWGQ